MALENNFKHITFTETEPEDEVIIAGVTEVEALSPSTDEVVEAGDSVQVEIDGQQEDDYVFSLQEEEELTTQESPEQHQRKHTASQQKPAEQLSHKKRDTYHEQTLEDLEPMKMPVSQKVVIIAAIILIIVAILYYFMVLR